MPHFAMPSANCPELHSLSSPHHNCTIGEDLFASQNTQPLLRTPPHSRCNGSVSPSIALSLHWPDHRLPNLALLSSKRYRRSIEDQFLSLPGGLALPRPLRISPRAHQGRRPQSRNYSPFPNLFRSPTNYSHIMNDDHLAEDLSRSSNAYNTWPKFHMVTDPESLKNHQFSSISSPFASPSIPGADGSPGDIFSNQEISLNYGISPILTHGYSAQIFGMQANSLHQQLQSSSLHGNVMPSVADEPSIASSHNNIWGVPQTHFPFPDYNVVFHASPEFTNLHQSGSISAVPLGKSQPTGNAYRCTECGKEFDPKHGSGNLRRHKRSVHTSKEERGEKLKCEYCPESFSRTDGKMVHYKRKHLLSLSSKQSGGV